MIRSMTGFGQAEGHVGAVRVIVEVRTVNHRFFSPSIKLPGTFGAWESDVREAMRQRVGRGHVTLAARTERAAEQQLNIDEAKFFAAAARLKELADRCGLAGGVDLASVLRMPEVITASRDDESTGSAAELLVIVNSALEALGRSREDEGRRLADVLRERLDALEAGMTRIADRAPQRLVEQRDRLREAVRELSEGVAVDETRLAQEIAILADRMDVSEEIDRFRSHMVAFRSTLNDASGEPVGKRLGFLLQEMLREVNTTGSKASDATILHEVVGLKEELERVREQVENLE